LALAASAGVSGFLFAISPVMTFTLVAIISAIITLTTLYWWRNVVGRIKETVN
jgi:membrane protein implicated in regulation of membrane protease activity